MPEVGPGKPHPLNLALRGVPPKGTPERDTYRKLFNTWSYQLDTEEKRKYVLGIIASRGDELAAVYGQGLIQEDLPEAQAMRTVRRLNGDLHVAACVELAFSFIRPSDADVRRAVMSMMSSRDPTARKVGVAGVLNLHPEMRTDVGEVPETQREIQRALGPIIAYAMERGLLSPGGEIVEKPRPVPASPFPPVAHVHDDGAPATDD